MNRRQFLAAGATLSLPWIAGCESLDGGSSTATRTLTPVEPPTSTTAPAGERVERVGDADLPVPLEEMSRALPPDGLLAIEDPAFGPNWEGLELTVGSDSRERTIRPRLTDEDRVVGVELAGEARAYPLRILNWHEIVNDAFGGEPVLVTYCPVCGSGMVAERRVRGKETVFGVTGLLWKRNLVMYDRETRSLWSQVAATAIHGPESGRQLELVPSTLTTWADWRATHPESTVLLPPPHSKTVYQGLIDQYEIDTARDYTQDPYGTVLADSGGEREMGIHPFSLVVGVAADGEATAYPLETLPVEEVVNDTVGDRPVVVAALSGETIVAYSRLIDGTTYRFERVDTDHARAARTTWALETGIAVGGRHEGSKLERANALRPLYLRSWREYHPETSVYGES